MIPSRQLAVRIVLGTLLFMNSCSEDFLEVIPAGELGNAVLATYEGVDALLIGAYSMLDGVSQSFGWEAATSGWVYGSIRGIESNKGTDSGDPPEYQSHRRTFPKEPTDTYLNMKWRALYESISRCNSTLVSARMAFESGTISEDQYNWFTRQARALTRDSTTSRHGGYGRTVPATASFPMWMNTTDFSTLTNMEDIRDRIMDDLSAGDPPPAEYGNRWVALIKPFPRYSWPKRYMQMYGDYESALVLLTEVEESGTNPAGQIAGLEAQVRRCIRY